MWSSAYCFTGPEEVHAKPTQGFSSQVIARKKRMFLFHGTMMHIMRPLPILCFAGFGVDGVGKDV